MFGRSGAGASGGGRNGSGRTGPLFNGGLLIAAHHDKCVVVVCQLF